MDLCSFSLSTNLSYYATRETTRPDGEDQRVDCQAFCSLSIVREGKHRQNARGDGRQAGIKCSFGCEWGTGRVTYWWELVGMEVKKKDYPVVGHGKTTSER